MSDFFPAELRSGLLRWTARHPAAVDDPEPGGLDDWPPDVGSVAYLAPEALVLIDPLLPEDPDAPLWSRLDELAAERGGRVAVLTTVRFHGRSCSAAIERCGATTAAPRGVEPFETASETLLWIEEHRALVPGDLLLGDGAGGLRLCPEPWLDYLDGVTLDTLRPRLRELLELPVELVLVSHGEPVTSGARAALERALA
jgi:glyoxylase-like metal-dependent hydrolase (beta-lactamase superfamily II)